MCCVYVCVYTCAHTHSVYVQHTKTGSKATANQDSTGNVSDWKSLLGRSFTAHRVPSKCLGSAGPVMRAFPSSAALTRGRSLWSALLNTAQSTLSGWLLLCDGKHRKMCWIACLQYTRMHLLSTVEKIITEIYIGSKTYYKLSPEFTLWQIGICYCTISWLNFKQRHLSTMAYFLV